MGHRQKRQLATREDAQKTYQRVTRGDSGLGCTLRRPPRKAGIPRFNAVGIHIVPVPAWEWRRVDGCRCVWAVVRVGCGQGHPFLACLCHQNGGIGAKCGEVHPRRGYCAGFEK
eukprot:gene8540-biopygen10657